MARCSRPTLLLALALRFSLLSLRRQEPISSATATRPDWPTRALVVKPSPFPGFSWRSFP